MRPRNLFRMMFLIIQIAMLAALSLAQTAADRSQAAMSNARGIKDIVVTIMSSQNEQIVRSTKTDANGLFMFNDIEPGTYTLKHKVEHWGDPHENLNGRSSTNLSASRVPDTDWFEFKGLPYRFFVTGPVATMKAGAVKFFNESKRSSTQLFEFEIVVTGRSKTTVTGKIVQLSSQVK